MTARELEEYLRENGFPEPVWRAGASGLLERWKAFVNDIERGYRFGLEKYRKELDLRGVIAIAGLEDQARTDDERFERMLIARDRRVWESAGTGQFWDFGYPRNAGAALLHDLKAEGLA